jgi:hypothetical protein
MDTGTKLLLFLLVVAASCLNNLIIPFVLYYRKFGFGPHPVKESFGEGGCNGWGIIMDGFLAGAINVIVLNLLLGIKAKVVWEDIVIVLIAGFLSMVAAHIWMSLRRWKIWIMPRPWQWNGGGYWHMVSMTLQIAFVYYPLLLIVKNPLLLELGTVRVSLAVALLLTGLFVACQRARRKEIKIGRLGISNKPW